MRYEESFGVIPLRQKNGLWEVFLIQHNKGNYWGFPKGHAEEDETAVEAAFRELKEETNLDVIDCLTIDPFIEQYQFAIKGSPVLKRVSYFAAIVSGDVKLQNLEIQNGAWFPFNEAIEKITHPEGKTILMKIEKLLFKCS